MVHSNSSLLKLFSFVLSSLIFILWIIIIILIINIYILDYIYSQLSEPFSPFLTHPDNRGLDFNDNKLYWDIWWKIMYIPKLSMILLTVLVHTHLPSNSIEIIFILLFQFFFIIFSLLGLPDARERLLDKVFPIPLLPQGQSELKTNHWRYVHRVCKRRWAW